MQSLDLSSNQLSDLPKEIKQLANLQSLDLRNNQFKILPSTITKLNIEIKWNDDYSGSGIILEDNPLESPPIEVVKKGHQAVIEYFQQLEQKGKDHIYEAKFVLIGEPHCCQAKRKLAPVLVPRLCLGTFSEVALPPTN